MRTTTKAGIKATYYNENVWKQERLLIYVEKTVGSTATKVSLYYPAHSIGTYGSPFVTYELDNSGKAVIDVTDLVRTYATTNITEYIYIYSDLAASSGDAINISTKVVGLIDPANMIFPKNPIMDSSLIICPPTKIIMSENSNYPIITELYKYFSQSWNIKQYAGGSLVSDSSTNANGSIALYSSSVDSFTMQRSSSYKRSFVLTPQQCDKQYAIVEWVSSTGATRRHVFEIRKAQTTSENNYSLLTDDNSYNEVKGREDGITLYLDGLTPYDYWYYSDIITSSKVLINIEGKQGVYANNMYQVQVVTKSVTQPDGNAFDGKLEINVNWKRYDAVAM